MLPAEYETPNTKWEKVTRLLAAGPLVVATVQTPEGLAAAAAAGPEDADIIEVRADAFPDFGACLGDALPAIALPKILTVRSHREGGLSKWTDAERRRVYIGFAPLADFADIELASFAPCAAAVGAARAAGLGVIASNHHFGTGSSFGRLRALYRRAARAKADVFKVATLTRKPADVAALLRLLSVERGPRIAAMGMGPLGKAGRPLLALAGSVFVYGYLDRSAAVGQWPARELKGHLAALRTG